MKKILSLLLVAAMAVSVVPTALATTNYTNGTEVVYEGQGSAQYTITVPALLAPGGEGDVTLQGTWASDATVKVTADKTVTLTNSINSADQKVLDVTFAGIEKAGDNTQSVQAVEAVSVSDISNALFGKWSGKFNYNVEYIESVNDETNSQLSVINLDLTGANPDIYPDVPTLYFEPGMTWAEWLESEYNVGYSWDSGYGVQSVEHILVQDSDNPIQWGPGPMISLTLNGEMVFPTDIISADVTYTI